MAGHSKWANIKHRKNKADAQKGKIFSRVAKEIISSVKVGGPDPKGNPRLRLAIQKARESNVSNEIIERNIAKASSTDQGNYDEITYELYGYGGVGIIVNAMTDNKNRFSSDMRIATNKRGGTIATPGAVVFNFDRKGIIQISNKNVSEDTLFHTAIDAGAEEFELDEDTYVITTSPVDLYTVKDAFNAIGIKCDEAALEMVPKGYIECDLETAKSNLALIEWIEDLDDVDAVYHNMKVPDELQY